MIYNIVKSCYKLDIEHFFTQNVWKDNVRHNVQNSYVILFKKLIKSLFFFIFIDKSGKHCRFVMIYNVEYGMNYVD